MFNLSKLNQGGKEDEHKKHSRTSTCFSSDER